MCTALHFRTDFLNVDLFLQSRFRVENFVQKNGPEISKMHIFLFKTWQKHIKLLHYNAAN